MEKLEDIESIVREIKRRTRKKYSSEEMFFHDYFIRSKSLKEFVEGLILNAFKMGSNDNITCVDAVREN